MLSKKFKNKVILFSTSMSLLVPSFTYAKSLGEFTDLDKDAWYKDAVEYVLEKGLFNGTSETTFSPDESMTRGMFVTILGRRENISEEAEYSDKFEDVHKEDYYAPYIAWAESEGIVKGIGDNKFNPNNPISRQDAMTIMINSLDKKYYYNDDFVYNENGIHYSYEDYKSLKDLNDVSNYAEFNVRWFIKSGLVHGYENKIFPQKNITRAETAKLFKEMIEYKETMDVNFKELLPFEFSEIDSAYIKHMSTKSDINKNTLKSIYDELKNIKVSNYEELEQLDGSIEPKLYFILKNGKKYVIGLRDRGHLTKYNHTLFLEDVIKDKYLIDYLDDINN